MQVRIETPLRVTADTFWSHLFFDDAFNRGLYQALGFTAFEVLSLETQPNGRIRRVVRAEPPVNAPSLLKKHIAARLSYIDDGEFDPESRVWAFRNESNAAKDSTQISGTIRVEPTADGVVHIVEITLRVSALGFGGLAERVIASNLRESYRKTGLFVHEFAGQRGLLTT